MMTLDIYNSRNQIRSLDVKASGSISAYLQQQKLDTEFRRIMNDTTYYVSTTVEIRYGVQTSFSGGASCDLQQQKLDTEFRPRPLKEQVVYLQQQKLDTEFRREISGVAGPTYLQQQKLDTEFRLVFFYLWTNIYNSRNQIRSLDILTDEQHHVSTTVEIRYGVQTAGIPHST